MPLYLQEHFERVGDHWDPEHNPEGYLPLCIAENRLVWDLLQPRFQAHRDVPIEALGYADMTGPEPFREVLANFLSTWVTKVPVDAGQVALLNGAGSVLEIVTYLLCDAGTGVLIPTPSYAGFWMDLTVRNGLSIVEIPLDLGQKLTPERLDLALERSTVPIRALLLTHPDNPTGLMYTHEELKALIAWSEQAGIHLLADEVYALSTFGDEPFTSAATARPDLPPHLHLIWAFSKDFAASGLRAGVLISKNEALMSAVNSLSYWAACSGDTVHLLQTWIEDPEFVSTYINTMRERLGAAAREVMAQLDLHNIPYVPTQSGFFLVVDLRAWLTKATFEAEEALWRQLLEAGINLTPGVALRSPQPGLFRLCFASISPAGRAVALDRLVTTLGRLSETS